MTTYQLSSYPNQVLLIDGDTVTSIPEGNRLWDDYQAWLAEGNTPDAAEAVATESAADLIADERFKHETAGITVDDIAVYTDRTTQMKLTGVALRSYQDSTYTVDWKLTDGTFTTLDATQIIAVANAVADYVQACYAREAVLVAAVAAGTYTDSMLTEGWPT